MSERKYLSDLSRQIEKELPGVYWKKIGDTFGGHKRLDVFAFYNKRGFIFEFKLAGQKVSEAQEWELWKASRSAHVFIAEFYAPPGSTCNRNVRFFHLSNGAVRPHPFYLKWDSGRYINLGAFLPSLTI